jgi:3-phenylpropionate/cinnamic acid dioxygenase small subunit
MNDDKMSGSLYFRVCQFLYREARLLDEYKYDEWFALLDPAIHYWMPARRNHYLRDKSERTIDTDHYNDNYESLKLRLARLVRPGPSSMDPRPREVRAISNIEIERVGDDGIEVHSVVTLIRSRLLDQQEYLAARRDDRLVQHASGELSLAKRRALITQSAILMANLNSLL